MEAARQDVRQKDLLLRAHSSSSPRSEAKEPDVVTQKDLQVQGDSSSPPRREAKPDAVLSDLHVEADASSPQESDRRTSIVRCDGHVVSDEAGAGGVLTDEDGDLDPPRKRLRCVELRFEHAMATPVADVGLQLWRGSLLACDWLAEDPRRTRTLRVAELGGGLGLAGIFAAVLGADSLVTDAHADAVALAVAPSRP